MQPLNVPASTRCDVNTRPGKVFVVRTDGANAGKIQERAISTGINDPFIMLHVEEVDGRRRFTAADLTPAGKKFGLKLLYDMYEDEDDLEGWEERMAWIAARERGQQIGEFPDDLLPKALVDMRKGVKEGRHVYKPKGRKKTKAKADKDAASQLEA